MTYTSRIKENQLITRIHLDTLDKQKKCFSNSKDKVVKLLYKLLYITAELQQTSNCSRLKYAPVSNLFRTVPKSIGCSMTS